MLVCACVRRLPQGAPVFPAGLRDHARGVRRGGGVASVVPPGAALAGTNLRAVVYAEDLTSDILCGTFLLELSPEHMSSGWDTSHSRFASRLRCCSIFSRTR